MKNLTIKAFAFAALALPFVSSCSNDDDTPVNPDEETTAMSRFVLATSYASTTTTANVLLPSETIDNGSVSAVGNGLVNDGGTEWCFYKDKYLYALTYNQGNAGTTRSYVLDTDGQPAQRAAEYSISRFTTFGKCGDYIMTASSGSGPTSMADAQGNLPYVFLINYLDVEKEVATQNDSEQSRFLSENFLGNGEYVMLSGFLESNSKLYSAVIPMGLSAYGIDSDPSYVLSGNESLVADGALSGTQYPNGCWVAIFSDEQLNGKTLVYTDKISYACGRYRSQYYQTIWAADNGDIYVFSPSFAKTVSYDSQKTDLPAGVMRIKAGATSFDSSFYVNIEEQSNGAGFLRVWHAGGNCFLIRMYDRPFSQSGYTANRLAIFNGDTGLLTYVTGLPDTAEITDFGKTPYVDGDYCYMPVATDSEVAIYKINGPKATAEKGLVVEGASNCTAVGVLSVDK